MACFPTYKNDNYSRKINGVWFELVEESPEQRNGSARFEEEKRIMQEKAKAIRKEGRKARVIVAGDQYHAFRSIGLFVEWVKPETEAEAPQAPQANETTVTKPEPLSEAGYDSLTVTKTTVNTTKPVVLHSFKAILNMITTPKKSSFKGFKSDKLYQELKAL